jgi:hypothetical protein
LAEVGRQVAVVLYVVAMVAVIVGVDIVFFRNHFWERLAVNIGIVLVFHIEDFPLALSWRIRKNLK